MRTLPSGGASPAQSSAKSTAESRGRGVTRYVECGPGRVLSGLVKRMDPESAVLNVQDIASLDKTAAAVSAG